MGIQWNDNTSTITAMTLQTVDSARVVYIDPKRVATKAKVNINPAYSSWRAKLLITLLKELTQTKT